MDVFEAIRARCSYRGRYLDKPVPEEDLRKIVEAGLMAPSGKNLQTTEFVIVDAPLLVHEIAAMHTVNVAAQQAKAFIVCVVNKESPEEYHGLSFVVEDCAAAVENMLLAITALGYATVWIDGWLRAEDRAERIGKLLGIPETKVARVLLPLGVPKETFPKLKRKPFEERAWFNRYRA